MSSRGGQQAGIWGTAEGRRLLEDRAREKNWKRWGPYLAERQWGTVREDYSADGSCWSSLPHDHARSRAYRWGEDGLLGFSDRECRICFALALWNGKDPILKERLFGLTGPEGNHGEDVKELYYYLDSTPTHSYVKSLYKYPQAAFPYVRLVEENRRRGKHEREYELLDTGVFDGDRYFDVFVEYAKGGPNDILIRITVANRGPEEAPLWVLPTVWFKNTWSWGCTSEGCDVQRPRIRPEGASGVQALHPTLGRYLVRASAGPGGRKPTWLFTENVTNAERLFGVESESAYRKDAFDEYVVQGNTGAVNPERAGSKAAAVYQLKVPAGGEVVLTLRMTAEGEDVGDPLGAGFAGVFAERAGEADAFYDAVIGPEADVDRRRVTRQAFAGLLQSKQFYHYVVEEWLKGDPAQPTPPASRKRGRNSDWGHLFNRDVISMPDKWEYPWYAAWDLAFHMIAFAKVDPDFAKQQLMLFLREWYMHPNGQLPAYEFALGDVNPPVHAWACWRIYKMTGKAGERDREFLARCFQKLLINFTWWVNRKDVDGRHLFSGGFLGLDNIGVFDRSRPLPTGGHLQQADGTAWMAFYCGTMLSMALELAQEDVAYEDMASKFFEHYIAIIDAMNTLGGTGLWNEEDGFYYDQIRLDGRSIPLKLRSLVGIVPLLAVEVVEDRQLEKLPGFTKRSRWFLNHRKDLARHVALLDRHETGSGVVETHRHALLAAPSRERLTRVLRYVLDEKEFLSAYGVRSLSKHHGANPFVFRVNGEEHRADYSPGESNTSLFGGNSNWRGPIWFPLNFLLIEALERYHHFYDDELTVECPTGSGKYQTLDVVADELRRRLVSLFVPDETGRRACNGAEERYARDPFWKDLVLFHEYFHGETGEGLGASHQTGWTALVANMVLDPCCKGVSTARDAARTGGAASGVQRALRT